MEKVEIYLDSLTKMRGIQFVNVVGYIDPLYLHKGFEFPSSNSSLGHPLSFLCSL